MNIVIFSKYKSYFGNKFFFLFFYYFIFARRSSSNWNWIIYEISVRKKYSWKKWNIKVFRVFFSRSFSVYFLIIRNLRFNYYIRVKLSCSFVVNGNSRKSYKKWLVRTVDLKYLTFDERTIMLLINGPNIINDGKIIKFF